LGKGKPKLWRGTEFGRRRVEDEGCKGIEGLRGEGGLLKKFD
jgi:hypothetical protein